MNQIIREIESTVLKPTLPRMDIGDTVKVFVKIREGGKERTQGYEGVIISRRGSGVSETITVRRVFQGIGIERVFLLHSPRVEKISVQRRGHVRRAKLYYLRQRTGKATRIKEKVGGKKDTHQEVEVRHAAKPQPAKASAEAPVEAPVEARVDETTEAPTEQAAE